MNLTELLLYLIKLPLLPLGFISILFIEKRSHTTYISRYIVNIFIILTIASVYYFLHKHMKLHTYVSFGVCLLLWIILNTIKLKFINK